ncbi:alpha/beta hydrolase [Mycobacteroides franklinii]|uniref:Alpha/beta hydrolase n=1 Tax=Mycobacteroides franklinii TaxID=948102 RepID=A0A4R5P409_9MYCO|nr:alpha/beta hydrolase [Mycobacteroides franklinii]
MTRYSTTMWEAKAIDGKADQIIAWLSNSVVPQFVLRDPQCRTEVYRSADDRVVLIATGAAWSPQIPDIPDGLSERPPHQWHFEPCGASWTQEWPARAGTHTLPEDIIVRDIAYRESADAIDPSGNLLDLYLPGGADGPVPLVIWTMGSGFTAPSGRDVGEMFAAQLLPHGYAVAAVAVRGSYQAQFPAQKHDTLDAVAFLRRNAAQYSLDPKRFAYIGHSSGGWSAAVAGTEGHGESAVSAVIVLSAPSDIAAMDRQALPDAAQRIAAGKVEPDVVDVLPAFDGRHEAADSPEGMFLGGSVSSRRDQAVAASPALHVSAEGPPFLIAHGTEDEYVPFAQGATLYRALADAGRDVTFVVLAGGNHVASLPPWPSQIVEKATETRSVEGRVTTTSAVSGAGWSQILNFLDTHLAG